MKWVKLAGHCIAFHVCSKEPELSYFHCIFHVCLRLFGVSLHAPYYFCRVRSMMCVEVVENQNE